MTKTETTTPRRRRTEAEIAQGRYDVAAREIERMEARRTSLTEEVKTLDEKLTEKREVRDFYAGHPGVTTADPADDTGQMSIEDVAEENEPVATDPS
jgi:hypothetical protein